MKILITGSSGFIGYNLLRQLRRSEIFNLYLVGLDFDNKGANSKISNDNLDDYYCIDLVDRESLNVLPKDIDLVIHLAALGNVVESVERPMDNFQNNVIGGINILDWCMKNKVEKFIFSSTGGALFGNTKPPVSEESIPAPISPYGASKATLENYIQAFSSSYSMKSIILRFANVIGPYSIHKKGVLNVFFNSYKAKLPLVIFGDGSSSRDYLHVDDLCAGIVSSIGYLNKDNFKGIQKFHLSSGVDVSIVELASKFCKAVKQELPIDFQPCRSGEVEKTFASNILAKKELNFTPKSSVDDAIRDFIKYINLNT